MNEVEEMLRKKKLEIDKIQVPEELETRLRSSLKRTSSSRSLMNKWKSKALVILVAILLLGYNIDTLAFYGKKLIGYDEIMSDSLKQLNENANGQIIGKSYTFKNGVTITLDGVMIDDNQMLAFYTIKDPSGNVDEMDIGSMMFFKGILKYDTSSGGGKWNDEKTEMKWISEFKTPYFFERKLTFNFDLSIDNKIEQGSITFKLDRDKAMGHTLKKSINKTIKLDNRKIRFKSILASPTTTSIKGEIQNIVELAKDQITGNRFRPEKVDVELIANGKKLSSQGGGLSGDMKGITFHQEYEPLPTDLKSLQIKLVSFGADHDVDEVVKLSKENINQSVEILGQNIEINEVYELDGETYITITTEESVLLSRVYLIADGKTVELVETNSDEYDKKLDGTITHTRTLRFKGIGDKLQLDIKRMRYSKIYNEVIDIPIN